MEITWLGHGMFQFRLPSGQVILMDAWTDGNPAYPKEHEISRVDTLCITHGHFDHIHDAVPLAQRFSPEVVGICETCHWLESEAQLIQDLETQVWPLEPGKTVEW